MQSVCKMDTVIVVLPAITSTPLDGADVPFAILYHPCHVPLLTRVYRRGALDFLKPATEGDIERALAKAQGGSKRTVLIVANVTLRPDGGDEWSYRVSGWIATEAQGKVRRSLWCQNLLGDLDEELPHPREHPPADDGSLTGLIVLMDALAVTEAREEEPVKSNYWLPFPSADGLLWITVAEDDRAPDDDVLITP